MRSWRNVQRLGREHFTDDEMPEFRRISDQPSSIFPLSRNESAPLDGQRNGENVEIMPLDEWDPTTLPQGFFIVMVGRRRTGKTTMAKWILQHYQNTFEKVIVMTQTPSSGVWQEIVGNEFVFPSFNEDVIRNVFKVNETIMDELGGETPEAWQAGGTLFILDDVVSEEIHRNWFFTRLATEGRHHLCAVMILIQEVKAINPKVRNNADVVILFNVRGVNAVKAIEENFLGAASRDIGRYLLRAEAKEHDCLVVVQSNLDNSLEHNFFRSTGDSRRDPEPFIMGGESQRQLHREYHDLIENMRSRVEENRRRFRAGDLRPADLLEHGTRNIPRTNTGALPGIGGSQTRNTLTDILSQFQDI